MHFIRRVWNLVLRFLLFFLLASILLTILYRFVPVPVTPLMLIRLYQQYSENKPLRLEKKWVCLEDISPEMQKAVIASEDQSFFQHNGFDWESIKKAYHYNLKNLKKGKKKMRGGSTISQQTAKNVFLFPQRNIARKALEAYFTVLIELLWNKQRILEVYLNVIETGDGIYGVEAAARNYYKISARELSTHQAAALAAILPNPRKWNPVKKNNLVSSRKNWIISQMKYIQLHK
ncbi:MAG: monofunctional biosynthetic peptidoglycan transglycosylase [Chitinophagales bacterium]|nr:monofunctional biosynthetic peptidoglycan transglycosylase [Chitinophagales bacterium]MDW8274666.1 monofunctional biosynthetic peptidoglycan transglycosylase [Chitinophagales bacterium]